MQVSLDNSKWQAVNMMSGFQPKLSLTGLQSGIHTLSARVVLMVGDGDLVVDGTPVEMQWYAESANGPVITMLLSRDAGSDEPYVVGVGI